MGKHVKSAYRGLFQQGIESSTLATMRESTNMAQGLSFKRFVEAIAPAPNRRAVSMNRDMAINRKLIRSRNPEPMESAPFGLRNDSNVTVQLARFKMPKQYRFVDELPRNAMGKIQYFKVWALFTSYND
ncbi:hypothetical protein C2W62_34095 [Candidatus Entotheonella serta]|nr:hypothetical protein C2W62_34095 [Candidatus Entotheonella serta]